jgi:catechol 2,3-dioxygenase-like lactoylglutathione lyase family enzyme
MGYHHIAIATRDLAATHRFYTEAMGFSLVKVVAGPTPDSKDGGWSKHVFYDTGQGELMAFWELHDSRYTEYPTDMNKGLGLPEWVNHFAFNAATLEDLELAKKRWLDYGIIVPEIDHEFCISIYAIDPNGVMVEFCHSVREFNDADFAHANASIASDSPEFNAGAKITVHYPEPRA